VTGDGTIRRFVLALGALVALGALALALGGGAAKVPPASGAVAFDPIKTLNNPPRSPCRAPRVRTKGTEVAIQDEAVWLYRDYFNRPGQRQQAYKLAYALGVRWIRWNIYWGHFVRHRGFGIWDTAIKEAAAAGIRSQITIAPTPEWDRTGDKRLRNLRPNTALAALFAKGIARHYKGCVTRYSSGNEVNLTRFFAPQGNTAPARYRTFYNAMYRAIKGVDRNNQVLLGEFTSAHNPLKFLTKMVNVRGGVRTDGVAVHPFMFYTEPGKPTSRRDRSFVGINRIPEIKRTLAALARKKQLLTPKGKQVPIYGTEFGYLVRGTYAMSEAKRKVWAVKAFQVARKQGMAQLLWYMISNAPPGFQTGDKWDSGLVGLNGSLSSTYTALKRNRKSIAGF
jgi:hypothetical protein